MTDPLVEPVRDALRVVIDPELGENIVDLGFVYDIAVADGAVRITMTATTPGCPATSFLKEGAQTAASTVPGVVSVDVRMTFEPAWTPDLIVPAVRTSLGFAAVN
ncbi:metal-sulfur cluster assembly factor [Bradyrhizobium betae]|uniref:Metal-sulfur cluster assembly factor n=1 Tax=Bradyrhizobium betae TaxID=244734 RepID=A0A5P6PER1_9BRAD|nr:metal-sulfur cluster assembly factor [Bradyrhizobium betae]MCS3726162.1 metal-sulfur cluster biosynthetic enzyme [Bradyrhizobium betae]QFI76761.1 metal-sulfur cluster assembly factor [Bradyrhizobium betae]